MFDTDGRAIDVSWFSVEADQEAWRLTVEHSSDLAEYQEVLPNDLEDLPTGIFMAAVLFSVDVSMLSGHDLVRYVQAQERLASHATAGLYAGMAELAYAYDPDTPARADRPVDFASEEIQAGLARTRRSADYDLSLALDLRNRMPAVLEAFEAGLLDLGRVRVFSAELATLDPGLVPDVISRILPEASRLTTGQLRARLKRAVVKADPDAAVGQYRAGVEDRKVTIVANPDHTASLMLHNIPPQDAVTAAGHIHDLAMALQRLPGETRTIDQLRTDIAIDLLRGKTPAGASTRPRIIIHLADATPRIPGYGPLLEEQLRQLLETTSTEDIELVQHPEADCPHQTSGPRPTSRQLRHIRHRYPTCVFPGCRTPATRCDIDHRHPLNNNGKTTCNNLAPLCRHHHRCKHQTNWTLTRHPDGHHQWTSPLNHIYTTNRPQGRPP